MPPNAIKYNKDELDAPQWLNVSLFQKILRSCEADDSVAIKKFNVTPASAMGDHYASTIFRIVVDYESRHYKQLLCKSMVMKSLPEKECMKNDILQKSPIFETECGMYNDVIPKFERVLRSVGDETVLGGRMLYSSLSPRKFIVFEDLVPLDYAVLRDRDLVMEEIQLAYKKLAKWHAISYKMMKDEPGCFDTYRHSIATVSFFVSGGFAERAVDAFYDALKTQPDLAGYVPQMEALRPNITKGASNCFEEYNIRPQPDAHYVLCHGDFHRKNMMFKYDDTSGRLLDVMLHDFQLCYVGPIVNDVIYSIYMLLSPTMRLQHRDELLYFYFSNFAETLKRIGYAGKMPTMTDFLTMILQHKDLEIFLLIVFVPVWYGICNDKVGAAEVVEDAEYHRSLYKRPDYLCEVHATLQRFLHQGYLDN